MVAPPGSYNWTRLKRHVIHLCYSEFKLDWATGAIVYNHIFQDATYSGDRLRDEWVQRKNPTRSKMWLQHIDKQEYTVEEQADRHQAHQAIHAALLALRNSSNASTQASTGPLPLHPSTDASANSTLTAIDSVPAINDGEATHISNSAETATRATTSAPLKRQASPELFENGRVNKLPRLTEFGDIAPAQQDQTPRTGGSIIIPSHNHHSGPASQASSFVSSPPMSTATDLDTQRKLAEKDGLIMEQEDEIIRLRTDNEELRQECQKMYDQAQAQFRQSQGYYHRALASEGLVSRMAVPQTAGTANQEYEKGLTLRILYQAQDAYNKIAKLEKKLVRKEGQLRRRDEEVRSYKRML